MIKLNSLEKHKDKIRSLVQIGSTVFGLDEKGSEYEDFIKDNAGIEKLDSIPSINVLTAMCFFMLDVKIK